MCRQSVCKVSALQRTFFFFLLFKLRIKLMNTCMPRTIELEEEVFDAVLSGCGDHDARVTSKNCPRNQVPMKRMTGQETTKCATLQREGGL